MKEIWVIIFFDWPQVWTWDAETCEEKLKAQNLTWKIDGKTLLSRVDKLEDGKGKNRVDTMLKMEGWALQVSMAAAEAEIERLQAADEEVRTPSPIAVFPSGSCSIRLSLYSWPGNTQHSV